VKLGVPIQGPIIEGKRAFLRKDELLQRVLDHLASSEVDGPEDNIEDISPLHINSGDSKKRRKVVTPPTTTTTTTTTATTATTTTTTTTATTTTPAPSLKTSVDNERMKTLLEMDYEVLEKAHSDMAHTSVRFFIAGKSEGDYHDNMDADVFFKWFCACVDAFPGWCQEKQRMKDAGGQLNCPFAGNFYDFATKKVLVSLCLVMDNASYHHSAKANIDQLSKKECAILLKSKLPHLKTLAWSRTEIDPVTKQPVQRKLSVELTEDLPTNCPSLQEMRQITFDLLIRTYPQLVEPPFMKLVREREHLWGNPKIPGVIILYSSPYAAALNFIAVEFAWADGKGHVGRPDNQAEGRTSATVIRLLRDRWSSNNDTLGRNCIRHCYKKMNEWIKNDSLLSGTMDDPRNPLRGMPLNLQREVDLTEWKIIANMKNDRSATDNDQFFGNLPPETEELLS